MADSAGQRISLTLVALFVAALFLFLLGRIAQVFFLLFIAVLLAVYLSAATDALGRRVRIARPLALTLAVLGTVAGVVVVGWLILPPVIGQTQDLVASFPGYAERLESDLLRLAQTYPLLERTVLGPRGGGLVESVIDEAARFVRDAIVPYLTAGGTILVEVVSVAAMAIFLARDPGQYRAGFITLVPPKARGVARTVIADLSDTLRAWIWAQLFAMFVLGALTAIGLWLLRVPYALAFGVFTGLVAIVPFFGTIVSTALPALLVLTLTGWSHFLAVVALGVGVHLVEANVIAPLIFEERISVPPVLTILSVLTMATLLGLLGLLVAVPLLAAILVIVRHVLLTQVYGEQDPRAVSPAVLVSTTGQQRVVVIPN